MKKLFVLLVLIFLMTRVHAQFSKATLQATGLTCAMCTNAIHKALQKVSFVESIKADIKNSAFFIVFKQNETVQIDALKEAVEDAGFSIGSLKLTGNFNEIKVEKDQHIKIGNDNFHFLQSGDKTLSGEQTLTVVDRNYVTDKQFKKYSQSTKMSCIETGKTAACCEKEGMLAHERVYHVIH